MEGSRADSHGLAARVFGNGPRAELQEPARETRWPLVAWAALLIVCAVALLQRLVDPLSTRVIGAEDPYTHMVFVKEHLARGFFDDSFHLATSLYPPGLHILVAALHAIGGISLYALTRFMPAVFGMLSVAAVFVLAYRLGGLAPAAVSATALAFLPEHIFRTNLMFPTALDLAIVPILLLAAAEMLEGRWAWTAVAIPTGLALVIAHPWIMPLTTVGVGVYAVLRLLVAERGALRTDLTRATITLGTFGAVSLFAFLTRWNEGGESSFSTLFAAMLPMIPVVLAGALGAIGGLAAIAWVTGRIRPDWLSRVLRAGLVAGALVVALPLAMTDLPRFVDYGDMVGPFVSGLALAGLVALPLHVSRAGLMGAGVTLGMFPLTVIDFFNSPYWPHRTVVYATLGIVLLGGAAAGALVTGLARLLPQRARLGIPAAAIALAGALVLSGTAVSRAPDTYDWYRLYEEDAFEAFEWAGEKMETDEDAVFVSAWWESNLYLKAMGDLERVHYRKHFYEPDDTERVQFLEEQHAKGHHVYVVIDDNHRDRADREGWDLDFVNREGWTPVGTWSHVTIYAEPGVTA